MCLFYLRRVKVFLCVAGCVLAFFCRQVDAGERCYSKMSEVLGCFFAYKDDVYRYEFVKEDTSNPDLTIQTYLLYSQKWPIGDYSDIPTTIWKHQLVFYIPKTISYTKALLHVNGGRNRNKDGIEEFLSSREQIDYATIASNNKAVVVELQDVPNQYLFFNLEKSAKEPFKEDEILAYAYKRFMDDPWQNAYLAGHLPMAKAILKAMDTVQKVMAEYESPINGFVLSGASKRGWAVWLAALGDGRVEAIVPIVIDVLNTKKNLTHICQSYGGTCPYALRDYEKYNFTTCMHTPQFDQLMEVEDPYSYLNDSKYKKRFEIPKYIINASGDNFFVPDSSRWYFKDLPQNKYVRYLPNSMHYLAGNSISDAINSLRSINEALDTYFYFILNKNKIALPKIKWLWNLGDNKIEFESESTNQPFLVKLWIAENKYARDFRFISSLDNLNTIPKNSLSYLFNKCDHYCKEINIPWLCDLCSREAIIPWVGNNYYKETTIPFDCKDKVCRLAVDLPACEQGWQASFVELHYKIADKTFITTSEVNIVPDTLPLPNNHQEL